MDGGIKGVSETFLFLFQKTQNIVLFLVLLKTNIFLHTGCVFVSLRENV